MTDEHPEAAEADAEDSSSISRKTMSRWGVGIAALLLVGSGIGYLLRDAPPSDEQESPALPACTDILSAAASGSADDGFALQDQPTGYQAAPDFLSTLCRFEGGTETAKVVVVLHAQVWNEADQAVRQLGQSSCPDTVAPASDGAGRQVVACVPSDHDPAKVDAVREVAAGRLWLSVGTTFQYVDSVSAADTADEARTIELTRAIANAAIELVAV